MKLNLFSLLFFSLILFSSCLFTGLDAKQFAEDACQDYLIFCGRGDPDFVEGKCRCVCFDDDITGYNPFTNVCLCNNTLDPCDDGEKRVNDTCECIPEEEDAVSKEGKVIKNLTIENDYYPLELGNSYSYETLDSSGVVNGKFTIYTFAKDSIYRVNPSTGLAQKIVLFFQKFVLPDSTGALTDTIGGPIYANNPDIPNFASIYVDDSTFTFIGLHQISVGDSLGSEEEGYVYFDDAGIVMVPAGTFENCVFVTGDHVDGYVFAPNVGLIKLIAGGMDAMVLNEFNGEGNSEECEEILVITDPITENTELKVSDHITISSEVQGSYNLNIQAANFIQMNPGFSAPLGAVVTALIAVCENFFSKSQTESEQ